MDALAAESAPVVTYAPLMEAIEQSIREAAASGSHKLHVLSDMLQHGSWYSHLELDWPQWTFDDFARVAEHHLALPTVRPMGLSIRLLYLQREGWTDAPEAKDAHWGFWREYFQGTDVAIEEYGALSMYPLGGPSDGEAGTVPSHADDATAPESLRSMQERLDDLLAEHRQAVSVNDALAARVAALKRELDGARAERARLETQENRTAGPAA